MSESEEKGICEQLSWSRQGVSFHGDVVLTLQLVALAPVLNMLVKACGLCERDLVVDKNREVSLTLILHNEPLLLNRYWVIHSWL